MINLKIFKRMSCIALAMVLIFSVTACSDQKGETSSESSESNALEESTSEESVSEESILEENTSDESVSDSDTTEVVEDSRIDNSSAQIAILTQEYVDDSIAEILSIAYEGEKNPEIESFNRIVNQGIQQKYETFMEDKDEDSWIEIRSYPFSSDEYLQIVTTCAMYPSYGTDGDLYSYNFDLKENKFMAVDDVLEELQLDRSSVADTVSALVEETFEDDLKVVDVNVAGFLITKGMNENLTQLLLQVERGNDSSNTWISFFGYTPELNEIIEMNSECLFDPADMDQMEPPFSYQKEKLESASGLELAFDTMGLDELELGYQYLYDGMVEYIVEKLPRVNHSKEDVSEQIKSLEGSDIEITTITQSDEHSELLTYPCWLVVYHKGQNEDRRLCEDVYVQTDVSDYRLHTSVPVDFSTEYHDEIGSRLATLYLIEK